MQLDFLHRPPAGPRPHRAEGQCQAARLGAGHAPARSLGPHGKAPKHADRRTGGADGSSAAFWRGSCAWTGAADDLRHAELRSGRRSPRQDRPRRGRGRNRTIPPSTRPTTGSGRRSISSGTSSSATRSTTRGCRCDALVHYGQDYDNAFWDGQQMVFGDGDGELFNRFTIAVDVIGHELTHGVTQHTANLMYHGPVRRAQRVDLRRVRLARQAVRLEQTADAGRLADRRRAAGAGRQGVALRSMKARARPTTTRARQGPAARAHGRLRRRPPTTTAASTSTRASPITPSIWSPRVSAGMPGSAPVSIWYSALRDPRLQTTAQFVQDSRRRRPARPTGCFPALMWATSSWTPGNRSGSISVTTTADTTPG